ncbi:hypothetical protein AGLY_013585 [Aphis glycines]|uniref:Transmembrane protein n=1 Tax=Aphis glycines TaxID=307491 RepID=A0A6G0T6W9_APHGL|nr:hypothetical protein AGLY_013585 [Aphis glycines]
MLSIFELQMLIKKIVPMYSYNFSITIRVTYEKFCIKFSIINTKFFMIFQLLNYLQIFAFSTDIFFWSSKIFLSTFQKKKSHKNRKFQWSINNSKNVNFKYLQCLVFELQLYKKIDLFENWFCVKIPVLPSLFLFFSIFLKTVGKCLLLTCIMHQGYSLFHRKPPLKLEIEALF